VRCVCLVHASISFSGTHTHTPHPHSYGLFVQNIINFLLVSIIVFFLVKAYTTAFRKPKAPKKRECPTCMQDNHVLARRCAFCTSNIPVPKGGYGDGEGEEDGAEGEGEADPASLADTAKAKSKRSKP
jgi:hypothetical protein